jgi:hypothetical protein
MAKHDGKSWYRDFADSVTVKHSQSKTNCTTMNIQSHVCLNECHTMADTPANMTKPLLDNQRTQLAALLEFESNTSITANTNAESLEVCHSGIRVSEDPGSGKTIISIALIASRIKPAPRSVIDAVYTRANTPTGPKKSTHVMIREFPDSKIFPCTVITVAGNVFGQWRREISEAAPDLKVLSILDVRSFRDFDVMVNTNIEELRTYDIILIKNGKMTNCGSSSYVEPINRGRVIVSMYNMFVEQVRLITFWRVINDDIDMSKLPVPTGKINAYSTINISATKKRYISGNMRPDTRRLTDPWFPFRFPFININHTMRSPWTENMQLCNDKQFIARSLQRVKIHFRLRRVHNPQGALIDMLGNMIIGNRDDAHEIIEMLNGEAFDDAAAKMGVNATSIGDIFRRLLGDKNNKRQLYLSTLDFIQTLDLDTIDTLECPPEDEVYHQKHFYEKKPVEYNYPGFEPKMDAVWEKCESGIKETDIVIDRFQMNICKGACDICTIGMDKTDLVIMLCCGKSVHRKCAFATSNIRTGWNGELTCMCYHCKVKMNPRDAFTTINGCNLTDIVEFDEVADAAAVAAEAEAKNDADAEEAEVDNTRKEYKDATKLDHMVDIILGTEWYETKNIKSDYGVAGFVEKPERPADEKQSVVFTRFSVSIKKIDARLTEKGISHQVLRGGVNAVGEILKKFKAGEFRVLVVNGEHNAAGVTLSFADNLIFMHNIVEYNIAKQIVGRIDRYGREYAGFVYRINYENEMTTYY